MDQRGLVVRARGGDHDAFTALVDLAIARLDSAARLILRDPELARDAVQEALIRAWRDLPGLRDPDRFDAWLHRLTVNSCLDLARRRRRRVIEVELEQIDMPSSSDFAGGVADRELLGRALQRLSPPHRAVIVLHYYLGMPLSEVAGAMGIPLGTAQSRLYYAIASMRSSVIERPATRAGAAPGRESGMSIDRFEQDLPALLAELAPRAKPDYRDDIVRQTARMRQRPAWMFPERWLPVSVMTTRAFAAPPIRWRIVGLVALLLLALAVGLAVVAGSQRHVPAPFGPAGNGVVAFEKNGDIFTSRPGHRCRQGRRDRSADGPAAGLLEGRHPHRVRAQGGRLHAQSPARRPVRWQRPRRGDARARFR